MSTKIDELPEECLLHILFLTSPEDILRSSAVSKQWFSFAISDDLWKKLVPSDYDQIIQESSSPLQFNSLKDLFLLLYRSHLLIDQNTKVRYHHHSSNWKYWSDFSVIWSLGSLRTIGRLISCSCNANLKWFEFHRIESPDRLFWWFGFDFAWIRDYQADWCCNMAGIVLWLCSILVI